MCIRSCLCWRDMKSTTLVAGTFALVTSLLQILVTVAVFVLYYTGFSTSSYTRPAYLTITAKLYIALSAADFVVVLLSFILIVTAERSDGRRFCNVPWLIWIPIYILYESAINIYLFYQVFTDKYFIGSKFPFIVPLVYWAIKEIILFLGWLSVVSRMCLWNVASNDHNSTSDPNLHLIPASNTRVVQPTYDNFNYGGAPHVQVLKDNRPHAVSHFDVSRPVNNYQYGGYEGGSVYNAPRYPYGAN